VSLQERSDAAMRQPIILKIDPFGVNLINSLYPGRINRCARSIGTQAHMGSVHMPSGPSLARASMQILVVSPRRRTRFRSTFLLYLASEHDVLHHCFGALHIWRTTIWTLGHRKQLETKPAER